MRGKYDQILGALKSTRGLILMAAFLLFMVAVLVSSVRLKLIINAQEIPATLLEAVSLSFIGYFFNNFLPTTIGGDVVKAYYLSKKSKEKIGAYTSVFVDRFLGLLTMIFMAFVAMIFAQNKISNPMVKQVIYTITIVALVAVLLVTNKNFARRFSALLVLFRPIEEKVKEAYNVVHRYRKHNILLLQSIATSIISQLFFFFTIGVIALSIGCRIPIRDLLLLVPIIGVISLLPSINGLGLREGSTVVFFGPIIGKEQAFAVSILWLVILLMTSVVGGVIYGFSPQFKIKLEEIK